MENIVINDYNLTLDEIDVFSSKVRVLLFDNDNRLLIANYGGTYLLPGGKIDKDETVVEALIRKVKEEIGCTYHEDELDYLTCLEYYQKSYPTRNGGVSNRLVKTYFFVGSYKGMNTELSTLTEKEKEGMFSLELIPYSLVEDVILKANGSNPRKCFFQNELLAVLSMYDKKYDSSYKILLK